MEALKRSALDFILIELESLLFVLKFMDEVKYDYVKQTLAIIKKAWSLLVYVQSHIYI